MVAESINLIFQEVQRSGRNRSLSSTRNMRVIETLMLMKFWGSFATDSHWNKYISTRSCAVALREKTPKASRSHKSTIQGGTTTTGPSVSCRKISRARYSLNNKSGMPRFPWPDKRPSPRSHFAPRHPLSLLNPTMMANAVALPKSAAPASAIQSLAIE